MKRIWLFYGVIGLFMASCGTSPESSAPAIQRSALEASYVYDNGVLNSAYYDNSWTNHKLNSTTVLDGGKHTLSATFSAWGALCFLRSSTPFQVSDERFTFRVYGGANTKSPNLTAQIVLNPYEPLPAAPFVSYCQGGKIPTNAWTECSIPLSVLGVSSGDAIEGVLINENAGKTLKPMAFSAISFSSSPQNGTGGASSTGGAPSTGGNPSTGGVPATGGDTATGGDASTGGLPATGGVAATGGDISTGGALSTGGSSATGGLASTGGTGMPRIGIGRPSYSNKGNASLVNDGGYRAPNAWAFSGCSATSPCWAAIDVGTGPQKVLAQWSFEDGDISFNSVTFWGHIGNVVKNYALYVSSNSTNGVDGTWVPATDAYSAQPVNVTGNTFLYRAHLLDFSGYRWIKIAITSSTAQNIDELELWDATASTDDTFFFHGDSNTASASQHGTHPDHGQQPSFQANIHAADPTRYPMMTGGGNISHSSWEVVEEIPVYLALFPMSKYWFNIMGTNDSCYVSASQYQTNLQTWITTVKAAGRIPILTHVLWGNNANCDANIPALNSAIDALVATNDLLPAVPLYERTRNHPEWFQQGDVHVNEQGRLVWNDVFADYVIANNLR